MVKIFWFFNLESLTGLICTGIKNILIVSVLKNVKRGFFGDKINIYVHNYSNFRQCNGNNFKILFKTENPCLTQMDLKFLMVSLGIFETVGESCGCCHLSLERKHFVALKCHLGNKTTGKEKEKEKEGKKIFFGEKFVLWLETRRL